MKQRRSQNNVNVDQQNTQLSFEKMRDNSKTRMDRTIPSLGKSQSKELEEQQKKQSSMERSEQRRNSYKVKTFTELTMSLGLGSGNIKLEKKQSFSDLDERAEEKDEEKTDEFERADDTQEKKSDYFKTKQAPMVELNLIDQSVRQENDGPLIDSTMSGDDEENQVLHLPFIQSKIMLQDIVSNVEEVLGKRKLRKLSKDGPKKPSNFLKDTGLNQNKLLIAMGMTPRIPRNQFKKV